MSKNGISAAIKAAREEKGMSVYALAKKSGLSCTHCYAVEAGEKSPSLETLSRILTVLGLTLSIRKKVRSDG